MGILPGPPSAMHRVGTPKSLSGPLAHPLAPDPSLQSKRRSTGLRSRKTGAWPKAGADGDCSSRRRSPNRDSPRDARGVPRRSGAPSLRHPPERGDRRRRGCWEGREWQGAGMEAPPRWGDSARDFMRRRDCRGPHRGGPKVEAAGRRFYFVRRPPPWRIRVFFD